MALRHRPPAIRHAISIEREGITYAGEYSVEDEMITVYFNLFSQTIQISGSSELVARESLAKLKLAELVSKHKNAY